MERRPHGQIISLAQPVNFRNGKAGTAFFQRRPSRRNGNKRLTEKKPARFTPYGYAPFARQ